VLLSIEAASVLPCKTASLLADSEGGAGSKATGGLLARGGDTLSRRVDDGLDTAARFLDSRNLLVACRIGMSENKKTIVLGNVEIEMSKIQKKLFRKERLPLFKPCPCLLQTYSNRPSVKN
jgi:hypothetical protein